GPTAAPIPHSICALDGTFVFSVRPDTANVFRTGFFSIMVINEQTFTIGSETLMNPEIGHIRVSNIVGEPFMSRFVDNDKIKFQAPAGLAQIAASVSVLKPIS